MFRMLPIFFVAVTTLMGSAIIAALAAGFDTRDPILIAAALGFVVALPVTWFVGKQLGS